MVLLYLLSSALLFLLFITVLSPYIFIPFLKKLFIHHAFVKH